MPSASTKTVLVVDDDPDTRFSLQAVLNYDGYRVIEAGDGAEGVTMATDHQPDLIVLDIHMPRLSGWQVMALLRQLEHTREIPIVVITGDWGAVERRPVRERTFHSWLRKPFEPRTLKDHIREIIGEP